MKRSEALDKLKDFIKYYVFSCKQEDDLLKFIETELQMVHKQIHSDGPFYGWEEENKISNHFGVYTLTTKFENGLYARHGNLMYIYLDYKLLVTEVNNFPKGFTYDMKQVWATAYDYKYNLVKVPVEGWSSNTIVFKPKKKLYKFAYKRSNSNAWDETTRFYEHESEIPLGYQLTSQERADVRFIRLDYTMIEVDDETK